MTVPRADPPAIRTGTSGWQYAHWRRVLYPEDLPRSRWLAHYAERFPAVEVNSSFYGLPRPDAVERWCALTPPSFRFALKAPRRITHLKKLKGCEAELEAFLDCAARFGERLGPLLFQLPPRWRANPRRLESFLDLLPEGRECAFELRDPTWHDACVLALLGERGAALAVHELGAQRSPVATPGPFAYVRLHGPREAYTGSYRAAALRTWVARALAWRAAGKPTWVFFDNDERGYAVRNARRFLALLREAGAHCGPGAARAGGETRPGAGA